MQPLLHHTSVNNLQHLAFQIDKKTSKEKSVDNGSRAVTMIAYRHDTDQDNGHGTDNDMT